MFVHNYECGEIVHDISTRVNTHLIHFCRYGEICHINLIRDKDSGKSKGFGFLCYEDQRSTILAVDNLNTYKVGGVVLL